MRPTLMVLALAAFFVTACDFQAPAPIGWIINQPQRSGQADMINMPANGTTVGANRHEAVFAYGHKDVPSLEVTIHERLNVAGVLVRGKQLYAVSIIGVWPDFLVKVNDQDIGHSWLEKGRIVKVTLGSVSVFYDPDTRQIDFRD